MWIWGVVDNGCLFGNRENLILVARTAVLSSLVRKDIDNNS